MVNRKLQLQFLLLLLVSVGVLTFFIFSPFFAPLVLAGLFAVLLQPLYKQILIYTKNRKSVSALITLLVSMIGIVIPFILLSTQLFKEAFSLYEAIAEGDSSQNLIVTTLQSIGRTSESFIPGTEQLFFNFSNNLDIYVKDGLAWLIEHLGVALSGLSSLLLNLFVLFISLYYFLRDGQKLRQAVITMSLLNDKDDQIILSRLEVAVNSVIKGRILIALTQGILTAIGFNICGIPNSILWGTVTVLAALIPGIGTALILVPGIFYLFVIGETVSAVGLIIWGTIAVGLIDNILGPKLIGRQLELHPLLVLLSALGGIVFFGPIGIFLGPLTISFVFACVDTYSHLLKS